MNFQLAHITFQEGANIVLILILVFLGYRYLESFWSYKINKPYAWERAVKGKAVSKKLIKIERSFRDKVRFYTIWFQVERLSRANVEGAFAELGVHRGTTAKAIHHMDSGRLFYLFDTFEGFDTKDLEKEHQSDSRFSPEMFADTSEEEVKDYIDGNDNLQFKPGFFPDTSIGLEAESFALVHVDADLYEPTIAALRFFYPRLAQGGVIIIHDYNHTWEGIPKALNEFIDEIPESLIEIADWQGSVMIVKNA